MKCYDTDIGEAWNLRTYDGGGDTGYVVEITREFNIAMQSEHGYFGAFREPFAQEVVSEILSIY